jgi:iron complex outermembrane receptor protein
MKHRILKLTLLATAISSSIAVHAQSDETSKVERIQVTGSHIKRTDMAGPSPVTSLSADDISKSGVTDLIGLFTKLPAAGQGTFSTQGNSSDGTANGGSSVSLRGLGADSTLILVNGRRISVSPFANEIDTAFVDINNIPIAAIKRVDILKDGASATYGSDAIAGVINIILKDDYDGLEISTKIGDTADGGGKEANTSLLFGSSSEKANHTFVLDYFDREEILGADRFYTSSANQSALRPNDPYAADGRSSSGFPGTIKLASSPATRTPDTFGNDVCAAEDITDTRCRYDFGPFGSTVPASERVSFMYMGNYEISDTLRSFIELNGQNSKTTIRGAASPSFDELFMSADNINHPFANDPTSEFHQQDLTMRRRLVEIGNREKRVDSDYFRSVFGFQGELSGWDWETAYSYIKSDSVERGVDGFPNSRRTQEAIDSGLFNPFEPSSNSQETLDFIETQTTRYGKSTSKSFDGKISGPIMDMSAGELMLAVGAEYREETISDNPDDQFLRGDVFGTEATQANGARDNTSIFAELAIPVTTTINVQVAVRHEDYSDFGTTTDPKVAFIWTPTDELSIRGSYGTAFRAPSLSQIGLGSTDESPSLVDTVRCAAVGNVDQACELFEYTAQLAGNAGLGPEESKSYNLGVIYEVTEDLDFSIDYYNYDIENVIGKDTQFVFTTQGNNQAVVQRIPTGLAGDPGQVNVIFDRFENLFDLKTSGLDLDVGYRMSSELGDFKFNYALNYVLNYEDIRTGDRLFAEEGSFEQPQVRWTTSGAWVKADWSANFAINYIGDFEEKASVRTRTDGTIAPDIDALVSIDTTVNYAGIANTILTLGVTNLLNEEPPYSYSSSAGYVSSVHNAQGRFTYLQATYKF